MNVFVEVVGPVKAVNPLAVPPLAAGRIPVTSDVRSTAWLPVIAPVPLPNRTPVSVAAPVPPLATVSAVPSVRPPLIVRPPVNV